MLYPSKQRKDTGIVQPISYDKRADIVAAKQRGEPVTAIKKWFNVSDSTISRIWNKYKKTGSYAPVPYTGRRSGISAETNQNICSRIAETPDITLADLIEELSLPLTISGLSRRLAKMNLTYKKRHSIPTGKTVKM
jgi:putative transposase